MRILYYNWVDYLDDEGRGGGVSTYQRNLMTSLGEEAVFLSSGISYDLRRRDPRWEKIRHGPSKDRARRFEIVNSGIMSPAHHSYGSPEQVSHPETVTAFADFLEQTGPYDIVHFQNLEGIPAEALEAARASGARVIFSLHNYYPMCPQVNLWWKEMATCDDFDEGRACVGCVEMPHNTQVVKIANAVAWHLKIKGLRPGGRYFGRLFGAAMRVGIRLSRASGAGKAANAKSKATAADFKDRRKRMVDLINANCDAVLCVSDAVKEVAEHSGITPDLLRTNYIGTRQSEIYNRVRPGERVENQLTLAYLGYMRRDKGFFFLLAALEAMADEDIERLSLVLAARHHDGPTMHRIELLRKRMRNIRYYDGYTHDMLNDVLDHVDVGLVPVLWHDNLPQVAIEMHSRRIPLLTSNLGGAKELGNCPEMVFKSGSVTDFHRRIRALLDGKVDMEAYWATARKPKTMPEHVEELREIYSDVCDKRSLTKAHSVQGTDMAAS